MEGELKYVLEALLFASDRPLPAEEMKNAFDADQVDVNDIKSALGELAEDYRSQNRGFMLKEIGGGWQILTHDRFSDYLKRFYQSREKKKLSPASMETLSVVAYKQPVTKADIEFIRGVNVDGPLRTLLEKNLVKIAGRKEVPGRPILYGTTKEFLSHFGINSLKELPPLSEFSEKDIDPESLPASLRAPAPLPAAEQQDGPVLAEGEAGAETPSVEEKADES